MQSVLVLGAGMVAKPLVEYLLENGIFINLACNTCDNAEKILNNHENGVVVYWEATQTSLLEEMVRGSDLVISLLPYRFHPGIARVCMKYKKPMVTTSYVSDEMASMDEEARQAGILILNEIGLDPGIDHMSAMRIIDEVHRRRGKIIEFYSICGALPSPEYADNPFGYKFSWSPKGVILASKNSALYMKNGKEIRIAPYDLFKDRFSYEYPGIGNLEVYPNRDSVSYIDIYGIDGVRTMYRGTFRFKGWCEILDAMRNLKMLDDEVKDFSGMTFAGFVSGLLPQGKGRLKERVAEQLGTGSDSPAIVAFDWLGLFSKKGMGKGESTAFQIVSDLMISKMMLQDNESDMILLQHLFLVEYEGGKREVISSHMIDYGSPATNTSIARTVGLPAAIASKMILDGRITATGVRRPVIPEIYIPVLDELSQLNIKLIEEFGLDEARSGIIPG